MASEKGARKSQSRDRQEKCICDGCGEEFHSQSELQEHQEDCMAAGQQE